MSLCQLVSRSEPYVINLILSKFSVAQSIQIHIPPHTLTAVPRRKPQVQTVCADHHIVAGPSIGRGPLGAVLAALDPPCAGAWVSGGGNRAGVLGEALGGTAVQGDDAGGQGEFDGLGSEVLPVFGRGCGGAKGHGWAKR